MAKSTNKYNRKTGRPQTVIRGAGAGDPFAPILRDFLQNPNIPYEVKGLVCEQVSRPPDWEVSIAGILATNKTVGRDRLRRMFKDAERLGHMRHIKIRDERGKILRHEYVVSD